jgi:hypothetical protein
MLVSSNLPPSGEGTDFPPPHIQEEFCGVIAPDGRSSKDIVHLKFSRIYWCRALLQQEDDDAMHQM